MLLQAKLVVSESIENEYDWAYIYFKGRADDNDGEALFFLAAIDIKKCISQDECDSDTISLIERNLEASHIKGYPLSSALLEHAYRSGYLFGVIDPTKADEIKRSFEEKVDAGVFEYPIDTYRNTSIKLLIREPKATP
ncbi:hypothetical protein [Aliagarivorans marinus]|nr:hypothetical protein [Aliagarivorans marinus]